MEYRVSWTIMDDRGLSRILTEYIGLWTTVDYHGISWIMDYHGLAWLEGPIMIYGLSWILKYTPPWSGMDYKICAPSL